jgi:GNAT superfamily N-acetyltransferase
MIETRGVSFRRAVPADRAAAIAIVFGTLRSFGIEPEPDGHEADLMEFGRPDDPARPDFVAEIDGTVVGTISLRDRGDGTGRISKFFVDQAIRGRGIGRALLELAVDAARKRSLRSLDLDTRAKFEAAIHLYESTGWKRGPDPENGCDRTYELELI